MTSITLYQTLPKPPRTLPTGCGFTDGAMSAGRLGMSVGVRRKDEIKRRTEKGV